MLAVAIGGWNDLLSIRSAKSFFAMALSLFLPCLQLQGRFVSHAGGTFIATDGWTHENHEWPVNDTAN